MMQFDSKTLEIVRIAEQKLATQFAAVDAIALENQYKVLDAFRAHNIGQRHFAGTNGYGYDDLGRDTLRELFAQIFCAEAAIVSPLIASGTHALSLALFGVLRPGDELLSVTGAPYDTLKDVISGKEIGSLAEYGVTYRQVDLVNGATDLDAIAAAIGPRTKLVFIGRSRGYEWRDALSVEQIGTIVERVRAVAPQVVIMCDNCYGEFMQTIEPTQVGVDLAVGSLNKNIGGGLAPCGGYICGKRKWIDQISYRMTAPGIGMEIGSYAYGYKDYYQGLFLAPHVTANAVKGSMLFGQVFADLGYATMPSPQSPCYDIIRSIRFDTQDQLIAFCRAIQKASPIDSNVMPYPWDMPGYDAPVIMAAGTFVGGASIELSADSPIREPYIAYLQGGLTYEHVKLACMYCLEYLGILK